MVVEAQHFCLNYRGANKASCIMRTQEFFGDAQELKEALK